MDRIHSLIVHNLSHSSEDLILNKDYYGSFFEVGDYVLINDLSNTTVSTKGRNRRLILQIRLQTFQVITTGNRFEISISKSTAETLNFNPLGRYSVGLKKVQAHEVYVDFVELSFKKQFLQRGNMWRFKNNILMRPLYVGQTVLVDGMQAQIQELGHLGVAQTSGVIMQNSNIIFRSKSTRIIWLVQISKEMWECDETGMLYFEKFLNKFVGPILERWKILGVSHSLTVIYYARTMYTQKLIEPNKLLFSQKQTKNIQFEDHFKVVIENSTEVDKLLSLKILKQEFWIFPKSVGWNIQENYIEGNSTSNSFPTDCTNGNFLEAINTTLNILDKHYMDRDLQRTGNSLVMISAGTGFYKVKPSLAQITKQRMMDSGIGIDFISLSQPPLHVTPLFLVDCSNQCMADFYEVPHWINVSFIDCFRDSSATIENYSTNDKNTIKDDDKFSPSRQHYRWTGLTDFASKFPLNSKVTFGNELTYNKWGKVFKPLPFSNIIKGHIFSNKMFLSEAMKVYELNTSDMIMVSEILSQPKIFIDILHSRDGLHEGDMSIFKSYILDICNYYKLDSMNLQQWGSISFDKIFNVFQLKLVSDLGLQNVSAYLNTLAKYRHRQELNLDTNDNLIKEGINSDIFSRNDLSYSNGNNSQNTSHLEIGNRQELSKLSYKSRNLDSSNHSGRSVSFRTDLVFNKEESTMNHGLASSAANSSSLASSDGVSLNNSQYPGSFDNTLNLSKFTDFNGVNIIPSKLYLNNDITLFKDSQSEKTYDSEIFESFLDPLIEENKMDELIQTYDDRIFGDIIRTKKYETSTLGSGNEDVSFDKPKKMSFTSQGKSVFRSTIERNYSASNDYLRDEMPMPKQDQFSISPRRGISTSPFGGSSFVNHADVKLKDTILRPATNSDLSENFRSLYQSTDVSNKKRTNKVIANSPKSSHMSFQGHSINDTTVKENLVYQTDNDPKEILKEYRQKAQTNPFRKQEGDNYLKTRTHNRRRWSYVFPVGDLGKSMTTYYGLNWKSLTQPAILPITTDYIPPVSELHKNFDVQGNYNFEFDNDGIYSSAENLIVEMVCQRLSMEFQLVEVQDQIPYFNFMMRPDPNYNQSSINNKKNNQKNGISFYILSMGHRIQFLMCDMSNKGKERVSVTLLLSKRGKNDNNRIYNYQYNLWVPQLKQFQKMSQTFYQFPTPEFLWNSLDYMLVGSDKFDITPTTNKAKRLRFNVIPNQNPRISPMTDSEYINKLDKLIEFIYKYSKESVKYISSDTNNKQSSNVASNEPEVLKNPKDFEFVTIWLRQNAENKNPNWAYLKHDKIASINKIFHIEIHWLVCDSWLMEDFINLLYRRSSTFGLRIIQIPEFFITNNLQIHPFRCQPYISLSTQDFYHHFIHKLKYRPPTTIVELLYFTENFEDWIKDDSYETNWNHYGISNNSDQSQLSLLLQDERTNDINLKPQNMDKKLKQGSFLNSTPLQMVLSFTSASNSQSKTKIGKVTKKIYDKQYCHRKGFCAVRFGGFGFVWLLNTGVRINDISQSLDEKKSEAAKSLYKFESICATISFVYEIVLELIESSIYEESG